MRGVLSVRKPNFATIRSNDHLTSSAWRNLLTRDRQNCTIISPKEMFKVLRTAVDRALTEINNKICVENENYKWGLSMRAKIYLLFLLECVGQRGLRSFSMSKEWKGKKLNFRLIWFLPSSSRYQSWGLPALSYTRGSWKWWQGTTFLMFRFFFNIPDTDWLTCSRVLWP